MIVANKVRGVLERCAVRFYENRSFMSTIFGNLNSCHKVKMEMNRDQNLCRHETSRDFIQKQARFGGQNREVDMRPALHN